MKVLTKSRFKLGLECPNKLFYTGKNEYVNKKKDDPFLEALAEGGFQVEELARMHYPGGILIEGQDWDYEFLWNKTQKLLEQENVTIYEAAFLIDGLFIRTDVLVKKGISIDLIEVKAKSFDPSDNYIFVGKRGGIVSKWKPYLFDIAFQKHVMQLCFPSWSINSYIMMADKSKVASIDGLNQLFRISSSTDKRTGIVKLFKSLEEIGEPILGRIKINEIVDAIESNKYLYLDNMTFQDSIHSFREHYQQDQYMNWPTFYSACKLCEFKTTDAEENQGLKSGFKECFTRQHKWTEEEFKKPNILEVWSFTQGSKLFSDGIYFMKELTKDNIGFKEDIVRLSKTQRQWLQIEKEVNSDGTIFIDSGGLKSEMANWNYPLHFIDFETSAAALPFNKGRHPYEQIAFQFSHHTYYKDGKIEHSTEYINNKAGFFPNFEFLRALNNALTKDEGTIFRYSYHENTILNAIYEQLINSDEPDKEELIEFIKSISHSKKESTITWKGYRDMVDLWDIVKGYYYNPLTKGSNSIKDVLPAVLSSSNFIREKYSKRIKEIDLSSKNFPEDHIWLTLKDGALMSPYKMLPSVFQNWTEEEIENTLSEIEDIANGGAALTAYSKLQYSDMGKSEIDELTKALLKYCELDTLAMVMIFEHLKELVND
jgi:hypothetical protein